MNCVHVLAFHCIKCISHQCRHAQHLYAVVQAPYSLGKCSCGASSASVVWICRSALSWLLRCTLLAPHMNCAGFPLHLKHFAPVPARALLARRRTGTVQSRNMLMKRLRRFCCVYTAIGLELAHGLSFLMFRLRVNTELKAFHRISSHSHRRRPAQHLCAGVYVGTVQRA